MRRRWVLAIVPILIGAYLMFRGTEHTLTVRSVPNDLALTLDGRRIDANGNTKLEPGAHTLVAERSGFETYRQTVDLDRDLAIRVYLFPNTPEGRRWEQDNPEQTLETEAEVARRYRELDGRLRAKYPILDELPYVGPGFTINQGVSKAYPDDPERLAFYLQITDAHGRQNALAYLAGHGFDPAGLELVYTR